MFPDREIDGPFDGLTGITLAPSRRIASWVPAGMLDWQGKITATLFLSGCGLRCAYCHNAELLRPVRVPRDWQAFLGHIRAKRDWLDGVVISGGEPCDDPDLPSLLAALAEEDMPVKLDTNGTRPQVLAHALAEDLVAHVALDVKTLPERYADVTGAAVGDKVMESIRLLLRSGVPHEFRTTAFPEAVTPDDLHDIASLLRGGRQFAIQQFRPGVTLDPQASAVTPYAPHVLEEAASRCHAYLPTILRGI